MRNKGGGKREKGKGEGKREKGSVIRWRAVMGKLRGISSKKNHSILAMPTYSRTKDTYLAALLL